MARPKGKKTEYTGYVGVLVREVSRLETTKATLNTRLIKINKEITKIKSFLKEQGVILNCHGKFNTNSAKKIYQPNCGVNL